MKTVEDLKNLINADEEIVNYVTTDNYFVRSYISRKGSDDILNALEDTLHRVKAEGWDDDSILSVIGLYKPSPSEWDELQLNDEGWYYIDLDYIFNGFIVNVWAD